MSAPLSRYASHRLRALPATTIWEEFTPLAMKHKAVNLGQGFPNYTPDDFVLKHMTDVIHDPNPLFQQYSRPQGHPELIEKIAARYTNILSHSGSGSAGGSEPGSSAPSAICPLKNVQVTSGTTQALSLTFSALVNPGDEVVIIEPWFDVYIGDIAIAGGVCKFVSLKPPTSSASGGDVADGASFSNKKTASSWKLDIAELKAAVTKGKTKMIVLNTPMNIPGKVWTREEMLEVAKVAEEADCIVASDEVYDRLTFDDTPHIPFASLPGMWSRTVTMSSLGKAFSCTGWKVGWCVGPESLLNPISKVQAHQTFCVPTPLQIACARSMQDADTNGYWSKFREQYTRQRELLSTALTEASLPPVTSQGTFFTLADISKVDPVHYLPKTAEEAAKPENDVGHDYHFCRWMTRELGVCAIPVSYFARKENRHMYDRFVRFAFCKTESELKAGGEKLATHMPKYISH